MYNNCVLREFYINYLKTKKMHPLLLLINLYENMYEKILTYNK